MTYKVLIVDDSKLARMAAIKMLKGCKPDWSRVEAGSASEAVSAMQKDSPDVALIDFNMPDEDGISLAASLRKLNPRMPIAIISANHQQGVIRRTEALGAVFLPKPVAAEALGKFLQMAQNQLQGTAS